MNMISGLEVRRQAKTESSQEAEQGKMQANHAGRERCHVVRQLANVSLRTRT